MCVNMDSADTQLLLINHQKAVFKLTIYRSQCNLRGESLLEHP